jgi:hypothetical protein
METEWTGWGVMFSGEEYGVSDDVGVGESNREGTGLPRVLGVEVR